MTLSEKILASLAIALAFSLVGYSSFKHIKKLGYDEAVSIYEKQKEEDKKITNAATKQLQDDAIKAHKDKEDALKVADAKYASLLDSLRNRKTRPTQTGPSTTPQVGGSCTGAQLYREDAEFLAGEAARADKLTIERDFYYERYERARLLLSGSEPIAGQQGTISNTEPISGDRVQSGSDLHTEGY